MNPETVITHNKEFLRPGEIPSIAVFGQTLPEVWENSVRATWDLGAEIPTEYDQPADPESRDAGMLMAIASPFEEPRIHQHMPDGFEGLCLYTQEVLHGIADWKAAKGGSYSYHDRLRHWPGIGSWSKLKELEGQPLQLPYVDQINAVIRRLAVVPHSRRAQAITWAPWVDSEGHEPPCLQRIWCRMVNSKDGIYLLEMNTHWRSRDALKAAFMNMYALTELQKVMVEEIVALSGRQVLPGRYVDISDSYHIYGSYIEREGRSEIKAFLARIANSDFSQRVFRTDDPRIQLEFKLAKERIEAMLNGS